MRIFTNPTNGTRIVLDPETETAYGESDGERYNLTPRTAVKLMAELRRVAGVEYVAETVVR